MESCQEKFRYKMVIEYCGGNYSGWQKQLHCATLQGIMEDALCKFTQEKVEVCSAGRTDSGVHALGQVAHFDSTKKYDPYRLTASLNHFLIGHRIGILSIEAVSGDFHARFSATKRHYLYKILNRDSISIIDANTKTHIRQPLDVIKMQEGANYLIGQHDFSSFRSSVCQAKSPVKTMDNIDVIKRADDIEIYFSAISFLHHMVRNVVGSLIEVGVGKRCPEHIKNILDARDRRVCGPTAPARGLYFFRVDY